jgi:predicted nucleotidyltransferase
MGSVLDRPQFGVYPSQYGGVDLTAREFSISNALFSSVQQRVLALIFGHPERSFYTSEIVRNVRSGTGAVERELLRLERSGLVTTERIGNQKHYRANRESPIFEELHSLVLKTVGLTEPLRKSLQPYADQIRVAFVFGSVAKGKDTARSDIDLMVMGDSLTYSDLYTALQDAEQILKRPVKPNFLSTEDWRRKLEQKNSFITRIKSQPKIFIIGSENDLPHEQARAR